VRRASVLFVRRLAVTDALRVADLLELLASGLASAQVIEELPDLEPNDVHACLTYASRRLNHPILAS
jgi:uncharacterized protein (DUF433 family)